MIQQLRASYIWCGELMADTLLVDPRHAKAPHHRSAWRNLFAPCAGDDAQPSEVTIGDGEHNTFTIAALGLPRDFAILRPSSTGYILTLGANMQGTVRTQGREIVVSDLVAARGEAHGVSGAFRAVPISPGDWGVVHLDGTDDHVLFFQFVPAPDALPKPGWRDAHLVLPALAISVLFFGFLIAAVFRLGESTNPFSWPADPEVVADYLLSRPQQIVVSATNADAAEGDPEAKPASTAGEAGKSGGEGDIERKRDPAPDQGLPDEELPTAIQTGLLSSKSRAAIDKIRNRGGFDKKLGQAMARLQGLSNDGGSGGFGAGFGTGIGDGAGTGTLTKSSGKGAGGGGSAHADTLTQAALNTGETRTRGRSGGEGIREKAVKLSPGRPSGDLGGLSPEDILKVVRSRAQAIKSCYERELQRDKGLGGKIVLTWKVDAAGTVKDAKVASTTMRNGKVEDCVVRQVQNMRFPSPKGGVTARVKFPFLFGVQ